MITLRTIAVSLATMLLLSSPIAAADPTPTPIPSATVVSSLRPKPSPRAYDNPAAIPVVSEAGGGGSVRGSRPLEAPPDDPVAAASATAAAGVDRQGEMVLRWLPEIEAAAAATGTPRSLIAGVMRLESSGDPGVVSVAGAQGLMQVMPAELSAQGIPSSKWQDPETNVMAGARILADRSGAGWESAVAYYFGIGCDAYGTCTYQYAVITLGWANYYAALLGDAISYDVERIPNVPSSAEPTPTPTPTATPTQTPAPGQPTPTSIPSQEPTTAPTFEPTAVPSPTPVPTEPPTPVPPLPTEPTALPDGTPGP